jgi:hypothetical protein
MSRVCAAASGFLWSLGAALLLISILLVPQSRALAQGGTGADPVCMNGSCDNDSKCFAQQADDCPNKCKDATNVYCKCDLNPATCMDCQCKLNPAEVACSCIKPN